MIGTLERDRDPMAELLAALVGSGSEDGRAFELITAPSTSLGLGVIAAASEIVAAVPAAGCAHLDLDQPFYVRLADQHRLLCGSCCIAAEDADAGTCARCRVFGGAGVYRCARSENGALVGWLCLSCAEQDSGDVVVMLPL